ncbi:hypothetical protein K9N68_07035 [Kovacikia minuta CCNUW1]|uniref:hypothetical protein n=1 Tax=Kovacikia minuta TaxID=2931930 RepID=UPI001CCC7188|nr:hypothetical protein [Kovacikia minuta]UBF27667.1 hypothetical protein K9N68_07035 [Kovacikia minuta CCNUW1]
MQGKQVKAKLVALRDLAAAINPPLAKRLDEINRWVKDKKPGEVVAQTICYGVFAANDS